MNGNDKFGIEIETVGASKESLARAIQSVVGGTVWADAYGLNARVTLADGRVWNVVRDGSLNGHLNGEVVSPILLASEIEVLQNVVRALRAAGAKVDSSCGIHVHVDGARFDARSLTNLVRLVNRRESMIMRSLGVSPGRASTYTKPINQAFATRLESEKPATLEAFKSVWYAGYESGPHAPVPGSRYHHSRYHGLNLNSFFYRGTVEFRYFNGTLHAGEVKAYVQFVLSLAAAACSKKSATKVRRARTSAPVAERTMFQAFMKNIGMSGEQFETARLHLTKRFPGGRTRTAVAA